MPPAQSHTGNIPPDPIGMPAGETSVIARAKARDEHAFVELLKRYAFIILSIIRRYIHKIIGHDEDDLMQEIHASAYEILPNFRGDEISFQVWLRRSTKGICLNLLEKQRRQDTISLEAICSETLEQSLPNPFPGPETELRHKEIRQAVHDAIKRLPEKLKKVVLLKDIQGIEYEEIAEILGIEVGTVKSRLHRGRILLRKDLQAIR